MSVELVNGSSYVARIFNQYNRNGLGTLIVSNCCFRISSMDGLNMKSAVGGITDKVLYQEHVIRVVTELDDGWHGMLLHVTVVDDERGISITERCARKYAHKRC